MEHDTLILRAFDEYLEEYKEKWQIEYAAAELLAEFEEQLAGWLQLFRVFSKLNAVWREAVFTGAREFDAAYDELIRGLFVTWLQSDSDVQALLAFFEPQNYKGGVVGAPKYRQYLEAAHSVLANWKPPGLSPAIGHHRVTLDREQSRMLRELIEPASRT